MVTIKVTGIPSSESTESIKRVFSKFGNIGSIKIFKDNDFEIFAIISFLNQKIREIKDDWTLFGIFMGKKVKIRKLKYNVKEPSLKKDFLKNLKKKSFPRKTTYIQSEGTLEVTNFDLSTTSDELKNLFGFFGHITNFHLKTAFYQYTKCKSVVVRYGIPECAIKAACFIEKKIYKGKVIKVRRINTLKKNNSSLRSSNFRYFKKLQNEYKNQTFFSNSSWISLFVGKETIFTGFNGKYGKNIFMEKAIGGDKLCKNKFLITQGRILAETRNILKKEGLNVDLFDFSNSHKKSRRCFFIKYRFYQEDLFSSNSFKKFGAIKNFYFFKMTNLIIIEYKHYLNAILAFESVKEKITVENEIIIEWIPLNFIKKKQLKNCEFQLEVSKKKYRNGIQKIENLKKNNIESRFYLKNSTIDSNISKNISLKNYFIQDLNFKSKNKIFSDKRTIQGKIIIRNIPFKLKIYDLRKVFSIFGKILSIRIPKKKNGENRGFAFIDYKTLNSAKKALFLVQNTQLHSRSLKINLIK